MSKTFEEEWKEYLKQRELICKAIEERLEKMKAEANEILTKNDEILTKNDEILEALNAELDDI